MRTLTSALLSIAILLSGFAQRGNAALAGTSVTGSLTFDGDPSNYFDPGYNFVPTTGYLNTSSTTVTILSGVVEFGFDDGSSRISADFSNNQLTINDFIETAEANNGFQMVFSDPAFAGQSLLRVSDSFPIGSYSVSSGVMTLNYSGGTPMAGQTLAARFNVTPVPEPSTVGVLCASLLATLAFLLFRKRRPQAAYI